MRALDELTTMVPPTLVITSYKTVAFCPRAADAGELNSRLPEANLRVQHPRPTGIDLSESVPPPAWFLRAERGAENKNELNFWWLRVVTAAAGAIFGW